ncbi:thiol-disulfide oxidoreductase DCC family protein [Faecalibacter rhinopitheci]|uniref:Thiol-disulfide oxidoreductase DCC family protein n=1 Tax=Faecalibacter rhinopitheci TaxID=2779678 RepID=A0A8J7KE48_9FLAO|nr:thiol-disulfide oxidoreductase DCC family protein [Faecalibacter rhinopitheci]MBF0598081.1 thiol-disulfide oxidoreductase DCC family protein [Faecalibacter rhinopitheci]
MKKDKIIFFDGVCNLCNSTVQFIIENDSQNKFHFSSLQSNFGQKFLEENNLKTENFDSIILLENNEIYQKSDAAIKIASHLDSPYNYLKLFSILPKFIRDFFYSIVAKNRYRIFGKKESCWIPTAELRSKFLE